MTYSGIALSIWVACPVQAELNAHLPTFYLVVPILVGTREIHCSTYVVSQVVGHNAPKLHQANEALPPLEGPFLCT